MLIGFKGENQSFFSVRGEDPLRESRFDRMGGGVDPLPLIGFSGKLRQFGCAWPKASQQAASMSSAWHGDKHLLALFPAGVCRACGISNGSYYVFLAPFLLKASVENFHLAAHNFGTVRSCWPVCLRARAPLVRNFPSRSVLLLFCVSCQRPGLDLIKLATALGVDFSIPAAVLEGT